MWLGYDRPRKQEEKKLSYVPVVIFVSFLLLQAQQPMAVVVLWVLFLTGIGLKNKDTHNRYHATVSELHGLRLKLARQLEDRYDLNKLIKKARKNGDAVDLVMDRERLAANIRDTRKELRRFKNFREV